MLLAHCTKSLRGHFLVHFASLLNCFGRAVEPKSLPEPEKVDPKKYIKNVLKCIQNKTKMVSENHKIDPRRLQDGPSEKFKPSKMMFNFKSTSRSPQKNPSGPQEAAMRPRRGPQEAPKRPPISFQQASKGAPGSREGASK